LLPAKYKTVTGAPEYPVKLSPNLDKMMENLRKKLLTNEVLNSH
jgi:hypothetical protein